MDEVTIIICIIVGALFTALVYESRKKVWFLEVLAPRQHYEIGKEKKVIAHMEIAGKTFHGVEAGGYKILLLHGDISTFGKPVLAGKLEEMYMKVLAKSLIGKGFVTKLEKLKFWEFIHKHIPALKVKAYMLTGELVSPSEVIERMWKEEDKRTEALAEMKRRGLIHPKVLWVKPYPPEDKMKEILTGAVTIPDIILEHEREYRRVAETQRDALIQVDTGISELLTDIIPLMRDIITSIQDPVHVLGIIIADRVRKMEGLGLEQLAERGGIQGVISAAKAIKEHKEELLKALEAEVKPAELSKVAGKIEELSKKLDELSKKVLGGEQAAAPTAK